MTISVPHISSLNSRALRGSLVARRHGLEEAYLDAIFSAYWEQNDGSIAEYEGLTRIAAAIGLLVYGLYSAARKSGRQ